MKSFIILSGTKFHVIPKDEKQALKLFLSGTKFHVIAKDEKQALKLFEDGFAKEIEDDTWVEIVVENADI